MDDQPPIQADPDTPPPVFEPIPAAPPPRRRGRRLLILILLILAFAVGVAATILALPYLERWRGDEAASAPVAARAAMPLPTRPTTGGISATGADMLDGRVLQLEERLNHITVEAQAASGNAARAEGLLVAFAARRALDSGSPLGYVEGQLRLRFGRAQPRAVATIINAAREPVTLGDLRGGLTDIAPEVTSPSADAGWWQALNHEARELVTFRRSTTPSPRPQAAFDRALRLVDAGRVSAALAEIERMPNRAPAQPWMEYARRYLEARRALDLIETAAILEPRQLHSTEGQVVTQTSPLAP
jgi:hypothetical protein